MKRHKRWGSVSPCFGNGRRITRGKIQAFPGNGGMSDKDAEIARLRQENRRLMAERDISKKATALFALPI